MVLALFCLVFCAGAVDVSAKSAVVIDTRTGEIVFQKDAFERRSMASTTKIMTALLVAEHCDFQDLVEVKASAFSDLIAAGSSAGLKEGEILSVENLRRYWQFSSAHRLPRIHA